MSRRLKKRYSTSRLRYRDKNFTGNTSINWRVTDGFGSAISSIALVALLVGSVGIVTTMYTSVTERTRKIGVMKAIGARDRNVLALFLAEAAIIGIVGASIGLIVGVLGGYGVLSLFALNSMVRLN
jgi:ABC-type antimicrobial peptide transport system permease subunit